MSDLELRPLGSGGPEVTVVGYGAMELRGAPHRRPRPLSPDGAREVLQTVLDEGITFIDTSVDYGLSEELIGRFIGDRRDEYILASKAGCPLDHQPDAGHGALPHDFSAANIRTGLEQSLRRLNTDHLDLLQLHISPSLEVIRAQDVIATLTALRDAGHIRAFGISSTLPNIDDHLAIPELSALQVPYSALERDLEARIDTAHGQGLGIIVRGGVAQGGNRPKTTATGEPVTWEQTGLDELRDGDTREGFLLRFAISNPAVTTVIVGTANPEHVRANLSAARRGRLSDDVHTEARRRLDAVGLTPAAVPDKAVATR